MGLVHSANRPTLRPKHGDRWAAVAETPVQTDTHSARPSLPHKALEQSLSRSPAHTGPHRNGPGAQNLT